jgi:hypothetical protein
MLSLPPVAAAVDLTHCHRCHRCCCCFLAVSHQRSQKSRCHLQGQGMLQLLLVLLLLLG